VVLAGRGLRRDFQLPSNKKLSFVLKPQSPLSAEEVQVIQLLLNAEQLQVATADWIAPKGTPSALTPFGPLFLPLEGVVDMAAERERIGKEIAKIEQELVKVRAKLSSETFVQGAPAQVVAEHRQRESDWLQKLGELQRLREALS
jgi:valyl-tRNA synthetase